MRERRFVAARRARWDRLAALVDRAADRGVRALAPDEIDELALTYRAATTDLAIARTRGEDPVIQQHLNRLDGARARGRLRRDRAHRLEPHLRFVTRDFPREVRRRGRRSVLHAGDGRLGGDRLRLGQRRSGERARAAAGDGAAAGHQARCTTRTSASTARSRRRTPRRSSPTTSKVAAFAFAGGMTAGLLTGWIILTNGLMVGALAALYVKAGFGADFWATIAPHGVIELSAIQIAGGAGLLLAGGYLRPGRARRRDALVVAGRRAGTLVIGVALLLCVAGTIEGFISPQRLSIPVRDAIGAFTAVALLAYLLGAGQTPFDRSGQAAQSRPRVLTST